ncbi:hypothetical protein [Helicobacter winghamensis]|uniref:hypothetical protein n=1 Tax=Helicobacter winghamensis TaxID=157268 RepID=UPI0001A29259|nr:hypothetical protein [Helicobacter winghamensis]EEO25757.1 hypothetical protein HWAG_00549 [Helicobacter winghamensis ATCC BAA-430]PKT78857.1 hypothetical protein BCM35_02900 [Helicobacter winghamensis]PKT78962.1 hypothetical protein BCM34_03645 [Helicobacter winghamensis]QOQ98137.1 hypothetical protein A0Z60_00565 [Helicobacter winghamensis]
MEDELIEEEEDFLNKPDNDAVIQKTCLNINPANGVIKEQRYGKASVLLEVTNKMVLDKQGLVHSGYLFSSAAYCALLAVNEPNGIMIGAEVKFLAPIELSNEVLFRAETLQEDTKKREVKVEGFVLDIKIFDAIFYVAVFDKHVLSLHITKEMEKKMG